MPAYWSVIIDGGGQIQEDFEAQDDRAALLHAAVSGNVNVVVLLDETGPTIFEDYQNPLTANHPVFANSGMQKPRNAP